MISEDRICAVVAAERPSQMWKQVKQALRHTRTVELRLDWLLTDKEILIFLRRLSRTRLRATLIATCRRRQAGGRYRGPIANQLLILAEAIRAGCAWCDLEIESACKCPPEVLDVLLTGSQRIVSAHFFGAGPANWRRVVADLQSTNPDAIKIAATCDSLKAGLRLFRLARGKRNSVVIPIGDVVLPLRCLALREGSSLSYAPVANATAPGQVSLTDAKNLFRIDQITRKTSVYGVIGNPIA